MVVLDVTYAIVKVDVTGRNDVSKRHGNIITVWQTSTKEVTALFKNQRSEMKGMQEKEIIMGVRGR